MTETVYVEIPLYDDRKYMYGVSLEGVSYILSFHWNQKAKQWSMDIRLEDRTEIAMGVALVPQYPMLIDYPLEEIGMSGYFLLMPVNSSISSQITEEKDMMPTFFKLFYVYIIGE